MRFLRHALNLAVLWAAAQGAACAPDPPREQSRLIVLSSARFDEAVSKGLVLVEFWSAW
jgi:hypothetical protein